MAQQNQFLKAKNSSVDLKSLKIQDVMTEMPVTIEEDTDLVTARRLLRDHKIRHLPVTHQEKLTGILSERDLRLVNLLPGIQKMAVADLMTRHPLSVPENTRVTDAVAKMAAKKYGCLIVTGLTGKIRGIFTVQDALHLLMKEFNLPVFQTVLEEDEYDEMDDCLG